MGCRGIDLGAAVGEWLSRFLVGDEKAGLKLFWHAGDRSSRPKTEEDADFWPMVREDDLPYFASNATQMRYSFFRPN